MDEPLRRRVEAGVNAALDGYSVRIGELRLHPLGFGVDLSDVVVVQDAHPDPPVASLPELDASVQWRAALRGKLVADFELQEPKLHVDLRNAQKEITDEKSVAERGWQEAAFNIYPLEINELEDHRRLDYLHRAGRRASRFASPTSSSRRTTSGTSARARASTLPRSICRPGFRIPARLQADGHADFLAIPQRREGRLRRCGTST